MTCPHCQQNEMGTTVSACNPCMQAAIRGFKADVTNINEQGEVSLKDLLEWAKSHGYIWRDMHKNTQ